MIGRQTVRLAPLSGTLDAVAPHLPAALVSTAAYGRARALAAQFPAALTSRVYLECRLAGDCDQVDLVMALYPAEGELLARLEPASVLPPHFGSHPVWDRLRTFCAHWADESSILHTAVDHLWLEFDVESSPRDPALGVAVPSVGISFGELRPAHFTADRWHRYATAALASLQLGELPPPVAANLSRAFERLPRLGYVAYIGVMFSRVNCAIRLCLTGIEDDELPAYLSAIGWPGSPADLAGVMREIARTREGTTCPGVGMLHVDVGATIEPRLGLEYYLDRGPQLAGHVGEQRFLDYLADSGRCSVAKRQALDRWSGYATGQLPHELWASLLVRRVNHVKVVYEPGRPVAAKGYLFFSHRHRRPRRNDYEGSERVAVTI